MVQLSHGPPSSDQRNATNEMSESPLYSNVALVLKVTAGGFILVDRLTKAGIRFDVLENT